MLILASVVAGLSVPETEYLRGYPPSARLDAQRPPTGFVPLDARYISRVLGGPGDINDDAPSTRPAVRLDSGLPRPAARVAVEHPFVNDSFAQAYAIPAVPFTARTNTRAATREPGEPTSCAPVGGTAWYRYTPPHDEILLATTGGSNYALALAVFTGSGVEVATSAGCSNGATGAAQVIVRGKANESYFFQITGVAGGGDLVFNLDPVGRERVSVSSSGEEANASSYQPAVSADGRYVAFHSYSTNLTPNQPQCPTSDLVADRCAPQVFVHDRVTHVTSLVSVSSAGEPADGASAFPSVSADGRYVAFDSSATNLQPGSDGFSHIYVHDRATGVTERVSDAAAGGAAGGSSSGPSLSADARYVAFQSYARDLTADRPPACDQVNGCPAQVFVRDRATGRTIRVSQTPSGEAGNGSSNLASISADGTVVAFQSFATNLVAHDRNGQPDYFALDLRGGTIELVTVSSTGEQANRGPESQLQEQPHHYVSGDGRYVAFQSQATNLVGGDTNGDTDFFVRDRRLGLTERVTLSSSGAQVEANPHMASVCGVQDVCLDTAGGVAISPDGRYVAFDYSSPDLADGQRGVQVFVRDRLLGLTTLVSVTPQGEAGDWFSLGPALPAHGGLVAFSSSSSNLAPGGRSDRCFNVNSRGDCSDIFVHEFRRPR